MTVNDSKTFYDSLEIHGGEPQSKVAVQLNNELAPLLSQQLYRSPSKAIEELVVNSYDAGASDCLVFVPPPSEVELDFAAVLDDGAGMDLTGLEDLWQIGRSKKRDPNYEKRLQRKQIGKFGIGKLATYAIADELTYVTRSGNGIRAVGMNFEAFRGESREVKLPVYYFKSIREVKELPNFKEAMERLCIEEAWFDEHEAWTLALLESLKEEKRSKLKVGLLRNVLRTAMPLKPEFRISLNCEELASSKLDLDFVVDFKVSELPDKRIQAVDDETGEKFSVVGEMLTSEHFPSGVTGTIQMTGQRTLTGKSDDIMRSHGFFVRVRERLVNESDASFGVGVKSYENFNRFRADIYADDLDLILTAPREEVEDSRTKDIFKELLNQVFNEARSRRASWKSDLEAVNGRKKEEQRNYVNPSLVEHPVADALHHSNVAEGESEADRSWFYLDLGDLTSDDDRSQLIDNLYKEVITAETRRSYNYEYVSGGRQGRMVKFSPHLATFIINDSHDFIREHSLDGGNPLLEDLVTAETLLEVYLREHGIPAGIVGEVLERRDTLFRSLAQDHPYSTKAIAEQLRDAGAQQYELEIAVVAAARALGFVAKHISGAGAPDGIARFYDYPDGEQIITLEAKSSEGVPSLGAFDFAGLFEHIQDYAGDFPGATGCLLVAPGYPGKSKGLESAASKRAEALKVSCWTIDQLASVVEAAETSHLTARDIMQIVLNRFTPGDVESAVEKLLDNRRHTGRDLYRAVLHELRQLEGTAPGSHRTVDMIFGRLLGKDRFEDLSREALVSAVRDLGAGSSGGLRLRGENLILNASIEEIERRLGSLTMKGFEPRRHGSFRTSNE